VQTSIPKDPQGTIDGAVSPERIPDSLAIRLFFSAVTAPKSANTQGQARQDAQLKPLQFSPTDLKTMKFHLAEFNDRRAQLSQNTGTSSQAPAQAGGGIQAIADDEFAHLQQDLSADALSRFTAHVRNEKRHMKIYPPPMMP